MVYVDTSALVPMFMREPASEAIVGWLESSGASLAISDWTLVEFASAMALKARSGAATPALARRAIARLLEFAAAHCTVATPRPQEYRRAAGLAGEPESHLRAGDALHLAMAEAVGAREVLCLDLAMGEAARAIGIGVIELADVRGRRR